MATYVNGLRTDITPAAIGADTSAQVDAKILARVGTLANPALGDGTGATTFAGGSVQGTTSKGTSFTAVVSVSTYLLTASALTITLDDALAVGTRWEFVHADPTVVAPAHVFVSTSGTSAIDLDDGLAAAVTKTWQAGRRTYEAVKTAAAVWRVL